MKTNKEKSSFHWVRVAIAIMLVCLIFGCSQESGTISGEGDPNVVAIVDDEQISRMALETELQWAKRKYRIKKNETLQPAEWVWLRTNTLNDMIQTVLLNHEAKRNGIDVSKEEFQNYLKKIKQGYQAESFEQALEIEEISSNQWSDKLKTQLLIKKLIQEVVNSKVTVSKEELLKYFDVHQEEFQKGEQVRALHIMVDTEDKARKVLKMLRKGKSFSELAREHSLGLEGSEGGDMGYFEAGRMPEEFDDVFKLKLNKVSDIIRTPYGIHVFKVVDKKPERKMNFTESEKQIHTKLLQQAQENAFSTWLKQIKEKSNILINYETLETIQ